MDSTRLAIPPPCLSKWVLKVWWLAERPIEAFRMFISPKFYRGLGQLEAYIGVEEGVAFKMDNHQFWDTMTAGYQWTIMGVSVKRDSSKFWVVPLPSRKVMLRNRRGMNLAPVEIRTDPRTFPVVPVPYSEDPNLKFRVYYQGNKVAFQAHNGLFLGRVCKDFCRRINALEASMFFPDDTCFFQPVIGDVLLPTFKILNVIPRGISQLDYSSHLIETRVFINRGEEPVEHTFNMTYSARSIDKVFWNNLWGLGLPSLCAFKVDSASPSVMYNVNNDHIVPLVRTISEEVPEQVMVPPKSEVKACLYADRQRYAALPFIATIQKVKPDGTIEIFREAGAWKGLAYRNLRVEHSVVKL
ncbi:uncharacterized protein LOC110081181 [Pogona vitticeps]